MYHSYHATTELSCETQAEYQRLADRQEALVLHHYRSHSSSRFSPEDIHATVLPSAPLTSVRRAISNLTRAGLLRKCSEQVMGRYGRPVHVWEAVRDEPKKERTFGEVVDDAEARQGMLF